jgi:hypothetical protein
VNEKKASIDQIQEKMAFEASKFSSGSQEGVPTDSPELQHLKAELDTSKKEYRAVFSEMQLCKDQALSNSYFNIIMFLPICFNYIRLFVLFRSEK